MHQAPQKSRSILQQALSWFILLLLTNCTVGPQISSTYKRSANFRDYQTYAWHKAELPTPTIGNGPAYSPLLDQQLKQAIESELVKEGMRPEEETPDLLIAYDIALPANQAAESDTAFAPGFGYGYSYWYGYRYRYATSGLADYKSITQLAPGTLIIDLIDPTNNELVWRGWYQAEIDPTTSGDYDINKAVANIMSRYPPVPASVQ
jgi:hypothetical protein